jgi:DNA polymerase III alpha subunit/intein/homing endonuclease
MPNFIHLHNHTQYSLLDGANHIGSLMKKVKADGQQGVAITDHGNMFGVFEFVKEAEKNGVKPIIGCEFYMVADRRKQSFSKIKGEHDDRFHQLLLAKNRVGYENLSKLCSMGFIEGMYSKYPRIDKEILLQYKEGLIASSCCIGAEVPQLILRGKLEAAEKQLRWWIEHFGEDYYIEIQRHHGLENINQSGISQEAINQILLGWAKKYNTKVIATNDSHYLNEEDWQPHEILLCVNTGSKIDDPDRFKFPSSDFYVKTQAEMNALFSDVPEAIDNTMEIYSKIEKLKLTRDVLLPNFAVPPTFTGQTEYLKHLTYERARKKYGELTAIVTDRIDFELKVIDNMGFNGYFLIVQDFITAARDIGVWVGPGRGCLTGDTKVVMDNGMTKDLEKIAIGDTVWTNDGSLKTVTNRFEYDINETVLNIKTYYGEATGITLTKDHKVFAEKLGRPKSYDKWSENTRKNRKMLDPTGNLAWMPASELEVGDWVFMPKPQIDEAINQENPIIDFGNFSNYIDLRHDENFAYHDVLNPAAQKIQKTKQIPRYLELDADWFKIIGLFAGDGWFLKKYRPEIGFVFNIKDVEWIDFLKNKMATCGFEFSENYAKKIVQIHVRNKHLYLLFKKLFNKYEATAHTKHVPCAVIKGNDRQILNFLKGYCAADGHISESKIRFTTVSRMLADQVRFICWRVGIPASLGTDKRVGDARPAFQNRTMAYMVSIPKDERIGGKKAEDVYVYRNIEGGILTKIRSIEAIQNIQKVYDIEIDTHHNYLTSSFLVHNSAAGSAVAFALGITNIDPIKYNLLFERFLNPERVSMPDIDIDFDDEGRQRVIDYVIDKYGKNQVAQIVTFGTMAAKSSIKDVARVLNLPLADADRISKYVPTRQGVPSNLSKFMNDPLEDLRSIWSSDDMANIDKLREIYAAETPEGNVLRNAVKLEGSVRNSGIHAAGVIIAPDDITKFIPVSTAKDSDLLVTQFEGSIVEYAGMLKMDFLGLKTLTILKDAIENIVKRHGESHRIDLDTIPLDDPKAYEIFQKGDTAGIFQFESDGMAKYLRDLKPTNIEDIIAMNALYRPGPMDNIPSFVARKHGKERIDYPHEWLKPILEPTYGIMVYQEQIMQTAQIMAGYSLGQADLLRRAMGKKNKAEMEKQRTIFTKGSMEKGGVDAEKAGEIFDTMEKFASYGFNRSHAAAYSVVAYQTAYLKAHYTAEFMASVLTHNKGNTEDLNFFLQKCKEAGLSVLGPDVNESELNFTVNKKGQIRFGLSALKGVGEAPVQEILDARKKGIFFTNIFDFVKRLNLRSVNKRCLESLVLGGAFDFVTGVHRAQYFAASERFDTLIDHVLKFGKDHQDSASTAANSLFGAGAAMELAEPKMPNAPEWSLLETLNKEKEVTGIYLTGHPLDTYKTEIKNFTSCSLDGLERFKGQRVKVGVFVSAANHKINKQGNGWGVFTLQDFVSSIDLNLFKEDYQKHKHLFEVGSTLYITANYQQRWNSDEFELKIQDVKQLAGIADTLTEAITIILPLENLTSQLIDDLDALCKNRKGKHKLKIAVIDKVNQITLPLTSKDRKVHADNDFLMDLGKMGLECKLS